MFSRHRRLREISGIRDLVRETVLTPDDFIYPIFVVEGENVNKEIPSLPDVFHYSVDMLNGIIDEVKKARIKGVILFGLPNLKDEKGSSAYDNEGIVQRAIQRIKEIAPELVVITDVCLCQYTSHGHCGIIKNSRIDNDESLEYIAKTALSHAQSGADMVAPSDMMDGRVRTIRNTLDAHGFSHIPIMSYSAKYSSAFYGPFREAAHSTPQFGDRKTYQMDPGNIRQAMREMQDDIEEGADIIMVKPALSYLDVIRWARDRFDMPVAAYNVSGEYAMIKAASKAGLLDERAAALEMLTSIKRAGADIIISYYAIRASHYLSGGEF